MEAYRISTMITARKGDPNATEDANHKRKLEEMRVTADCQVMLLKATSNCNVTAAIMNKRSKRTSRGEDDAEDDIDMEEEED